MRALTYAITGMLLVASAVAQQPPASTSGESSSLSTQRDKASYALGMSMGTSLRKQSVEINPNVLMQGLKDAMAGGKTLMTEDEARSVLLQLQQQKMKEVAQKNLYEGDKFLAENKMRSGVVVMPSGLQYKVLVAGNGSKPMLTDTVVCNYRGTFINGTEFDSSYKTGQPVTFAVNQVIRGWTEALQIMPVGSKWQLFIPPQLAYGEQGAGDDIPPNATLIFEVELVSIQRR